MPWVPLGTSGVIHEEGSTDILQGAGGGLQLLHPCQCHCQLSGQVQNILAKPSYCGKAVLLPSCTLLSFGPFQASSTPQSLFWWKWCRSCKISFIFFAVLITVQKTPFAITSHGILE